MTIQVNGKSKEIDRQEILVLDLLQLLDVESPDMVSVQLNGSILQKQAYGTDTVKDGDEVEFLYFMGGGA